MTMILPHNSNDFDNMANEIATDFLSNGQELNDGVIKVANRDNLNPEETRRLVEKVNVLTSVKMLKVSTDRQIEYKLADYNDVIGATHGNSSMQETTTTIDSSKSEIPSHLPNTNSGTDKVVFSQPKTASDTNANKPVSLASEIFKTRIAMDQLRQRKIASEISFTKNLDFILGEFERLNGPDFTKFANSIFSYDGNVAVPIVNTIAKLLKTTVSLEKVAEIIDDSDLLFRKYAQIKNDLKNILELDKQYKALSDTHAELSRTGEALYARKFAVKNEDRRTNKGEP